jgi:hypothetical protein
MMLPVVGAPGCCAVCHTRLLVGRRQALRFPVLAYRLPHTEGLSVPLHGGVHAGANNQEISPLQDARNHDTELFPFFLSAVRLGLRYPLSSAEGGAFRLGVAQPWGGGGRGGGGGGGGGGAPPPPPQRILRSCWAGEGLWAYQEGQMGQKMVRFAQLGAARSRRDKSIEVGEVGSKRPSSGGNGGHVLSLYPLTWRSLCRRRWGAAGVQQQARREPVDRDGQVEMCSFDQIVR